jgi:hypothetical protein
MDEVAVGKLADIADGDSPFATGRSLSACRTRRIAPLCRSPRRAVRTRPAACRAASRRPSSHRL